MAFEILRLMPEISVKANCWSYNSVINAFEAASQWQMALFQLHDMKKHTLEPWNWKDWNGLYGAIGSVRFVGRHFGLMD